MSIGEKIDIITFMTIENRTVGQIVGKTTDQQWLSMTMDFCPDISLTVKEKSRAKSYLLKGKERTFEPVLDSVIYKKEPLLTEKMFTEEDLLKSGQERGEFFDRKITNFLVDWVLKKYSMSDDKSKLLHKGKKFEDALNNTVPYSALRNNVDRLGLAGGLKNIKLFSLDKGEIDSVFCKNREEMGEMMFILSADYTCGYGSFLVSTVFGFCLTNIQEGRTYVPLVTTTNFVDLSNDLVANLSNKSLRRYSSRRNTFCNGDCEIFD